MDFAAISTFDAFDDIPNVLHLCATN